MKRKVIGLSEENMALCSWSTEAMARMFFPNVFFAPFGDPHREICAALDDPDIKKVNIRASRGLGKTSLVSKAYLARLILFRKARYIVYITKSESLAIQKTESLKRLLLRAPMVKATFPPIRAEKGKAAEDGGDTPFSQTSWVANETTMVFARGLGQEVRGLLFDEFRPDVIVMDDVQSVKELRNEEKRQEDWEWLRGDVEEAVDLYRGKFKLVFIDTVKHEDALSERIAELPDWKTLTVPICDEQMRSRCPELISDDQLAIKYESHKVSGTLDVFAREVQCKPQSRENSSFRREHFQYYNEMERTFRETSRELVNVVIVDPARSENAESAESAIVGVGVHLGRGSVYFRDVISEKLSPEKVQDEAIGMARRLNARAIAVEATGLGSWGIYPFENEVRRQGVLLPIVPLNAAKGKSEKGKIERIKALVSFYRRGQIFHNPSCAAKLEQQLLGFPNSKYWDVMDAFAYVVQVLDQGESFFLPKGYSEEVGDEEHRELALLSREDRREKALPDWRLN
jgi:hypothetical protein